MCLVYKNKNPNAGPESSFPRLPCPPLPPPLGPPPPFYFLAFFFGFISVFLCSPAPVFFSSAAGSFLKRIKVTKCCVVLECFDLGVVPPPPFPHHFSRVIPLFGITVTLRPPRPPPPCSQRRPGHPRALRGPYGPFTTLRTALRHRPSRHSAPLYGIALRDTPRRFIARRRFTALRLTTPGGALRQRPGRGGRRRRFAADAR